MHDIILGRSPKDSKILGTKGTVRIGKQYVQMGQSSSLSNSIYLDVARAHAILIVGKRGGGKSYTMGSIAEGLADMDPDVSKNLSFLMLDTMGVYWSMKYANKKDDELLKKWGLEGKGLDVIVCVPGGYFQKYQEDGIECDYPLYIKPCELSLEDWRLAFKLDVDNSVYILLAKVIGKLLDKEINFDLDDIISALGKEEQLSKEIVLSAITRFEQAKSWGIFSKDARPIRELLFRGKVTVLDFSAYVSMPGGWEVKALALGLIAKKIFVERMLVRKREELAQITSKVQISDSVEVEDDLPMPWLIVDECLTYNSLVQTENGLIEIGKIVEENMNVKVLGYHKRLKEFDYYNITKRFNQGIKNVIEVKTVSSTLRCTKNHKVYSKEGFKEIKECDEIGILNRCEYHYNKELVIARLIGHIYGDGWLSAKQVGFSSNKREHLELIKKDLDILKLKSSNVYKRETNSKIKTTDNVTREVKGDSLSIFGSTKVYAFFKNLDCVEGNKVNQATYIPKWLMNSSDGEKAEFLGALFGADSNIPSQSSTARSDFNPIRLIFYRREDLEKEGFEYANQIKQLFLDLGISISNVSKRKGNIRVDGSKSIRFEITIGKEIRNMILFFKKVGYRYEIRKEIEAKQWLSYLNFKQYSLERKKKLRTEVLKIRKEKGWGKVRIARELNIPKYQVGEWIYYNRGVSLGWKFPKYDEWANENCRDNLIFEKIISKESKGEENVYDIEVEDVHNFIANDYLVHNCHEFLPESGETPATNALMTILREGRQPGVSIIMATQQPAKIHTDAITQSDIVLAHRLTASFDLQSLDKIFLSYNSKGSKALFNQMPKTKGCAIIMDDKNERLYTMQVKPRISWHGGEDPSAIEEIEEEFDF